MINFNELTIIDSPIEVGSIVKQNFIIGYDPFDIRNKSKSANINVFHVYDKIHQRTTLKIVTKRDFNWFVDFVTKSFLKSDFKVSHKFINNDGRARSVEQIRSQSGGFKEYIDPQ
ncbi:MAG: hypothetical protein ACK53T_02285 [Planctomycetota bacterium]|jgi:hypothetical protein